ncbi:MAG: fumarylacetoacetate hydrolase family protein, partial [Variovorax sp.]
YQPLGPFLAKNFATTLSPWLVTMEALAPFRAAFARPAGDPQPLPYLDGAANRQSGALAITLEVWLQTAKMRGAGIGPTRLTRGDTTQAAYWTAAQLVTHHTVNGCNLQPGDLLGSGTLSGPDADQAGSLLELTLGGKQPITLPNGEQRTFLEDGDTLTLRGYCERDGAVRIGLGEVSGTVVG